jgi:hypothetical protein
MGSMVYRLRMRLRTHLLRVASLGCAGTLALASGPGWAYDQRVHVYVSGKVATGQLPHAIGPEDPAAVELLRQTVYQLASSASDEILRRRFAARYPSLERFDSWEWKRFLALNPEAKVAGIDPDAELPRGEDLQAVYAAASRLPDDDLRNQSRYRHDASRAVLVDNWGQPLPEDPATLALGRLTGLSSQAHAHYGLPRLELSDDPEVLKTDPRRFALPATTKSFGADFAETYTVLALVASRIAGGSRVALVHAGAAAHHIEDVANQIHTVQVGLYEFFVDAKLESIKEELKSAGGLLRPRKAFVEIGIDILTNHHVLAEALFAKHLLEPSDPVARSFERALATVDDAPWQRAKADGCLPGFARRIVEDLAEVSSHEGPEVYRLIRSAAQRRWSQAGQHFDDEDDADGALRPGAETSAFFALEVRGLVRAVAALTLWWGHLEPCLGASDADLEALARTWIAERLDALDAVDERVRAYQPKAPPQNVINLWVPVGYAAALALLLGIAVLARRVASRRRP